MRKPVFIFLLLIATTVAAWAFSTVDARSRLLLNQSVDHVRRSNATAGTYQAFITLDDSASIKTLQQLGVRVSARFGNQVTASMTRDEIAAVASCAGVRRLALAKPLNLCNDTARMLSAVDPVHAGHGLSSPLRGKGVIVGIVDTGIDFNHMNLCDETGRTRVRAVYMPCDSTGVSPVIDGDTLPGSCYEDPAQIAVLTTDYKRSSHGTHTAGTAAGAYRDNGWYGMAPEADIVACGIPANQLTDINVALSVRYIFDYAERVGLPCVINMSLGTNEGPNDGSSELCRVFDSLTGPGRLCVVSAGNDGNAPICLHDRIGGANDTVTTFIRNRSGGMKREGYVSMWSDADQVHRTRLVVINRSTGVVEYASDMFSHLPEDSVFTISSDEDDAFAEYYEGEVSFASALEPRFDQSGVLIDSCRYHSYWMFEVTSQAAGHLLGFQYVADEPLGLSGWCTNEAYFYSFGQDYATGGTASGSISDLATTNSVISVGAYCSRASYIDQWGEAVTYTDCNPGDMAAFSSYGPDERGIDRPDVCAPGQAVLSSANRYDASSIRLRWPAAAVVDSVEYPYYANQGTSMSAPVVTGTIALMLQLNPKLTPGDVRSVFSRSSTRDNFVVNGDPLRWGFGKLNALSAIEDVLNNTMLPGDVNNDREVNVADVMALMDIILDPAASQDAATMLRADVNRDQEILVSDINCVIDLILKQ